MIQSNTEQVSSGLRSPTTSPADAMSYYVVCIDYGKRGREAIVDPEITRREVISRIRSGEYDRNRIAFIHFISMNDVPQDVTAELLSEADALQAAE